VKSEMSNNSLVAGKGQKSSESPMRSSPELVGGKKGWGGWGGGFGVCCGFRWECPT